ncbi:phage tail protein, partial [Escherichia coli]|uniref:phage tail assembly chaperone n=1 Tax=Escherichia coli TaxID=562 RepID=UPI00135D9C9A
MGKNMRELALARLSGFRNKTEVVKEWGGVGVILREPSAEAWLRWQEIVKESDEELSVSEKAMRNLRADVT